MCCMIIEGKTHDRMIEAGIDVTKSCVGDVDDANFFENNFGENKYFPGGHRMRWSYFHAAIKI